ncbi:MAG: hypothetical protein AB7G75_04115 [Candidatus Binatia bacterium]
MNVLHKIFALSYVAAAILFLSCALVLIVIAGLQLWQGVTVKANNAIFQRFDTILESIAVVTIAIAALELGQTVLEEKVMRSAHMSAPTRVRRFLSRFMVVIVVSLSIESLVAVFQFSRKQPEFLPQAAVVGVAAAALLMSWALFVWLNRSVEELEPEAMEAAKKEDQKVEPSDGPLE